MSKNRLILKENLAIERILLIFIYYHLYISDSKNESMVYLNKLIKQEKLNKKKVYKTLENFLYKHQRKYNLYISIEKAY